MWSLWNSETFCCRRVESSRMCGRPGMGLTVKVWREVILPILRAEVN